MKKSKINAISFCDYTKVDIGEWMTIGGTLAAAIGSLLIIRNRCHFCDPTRGKAAEGIQDLYDVLNRSKK